jgi:ubiquinone/menaquinone biosynthesis C-methylase UbiE
MLKKIKELFSIQRNRIILLRKGPILRNVLELGCGDGSNSKFLKDIFPDVEYHGVDILDDDKVIPGVIYEKMNLEDSILPYSDNYFDFIVFTHVIEHLKNVSLLGSEINRVLKKGGRIYLETPNWTTMLVPSFAFQRNQHYPLNFFDDPTHTKPWTKQSLFEYVSTSCSLKVVKLGTVRNWIRIPFDIFLIIYGFVFRKRWRIVSSFWNLYGWSINIVGIKQ